ncbi:MAG: hypothetical protein ACP5G3_07570, partial [Sulfurihydrogenibium sp.]|uniref:hypothetical protein n=1 Tax=Sulfurihydrogenibium sp. TaxID=2053621 RepID=UPI003D0B8308
MIRILSFLTLIIGILSIGCAMDSQYYNKLDYQAKQWLTQKDNNSKETFKVLIKDKSCLDKFKGIEVVVSGDRVVVIKASKEELKSIIKLDCVEYVESERKLEL